MHVVDLGRPLFIDRAIISRDFSFPVISKALQLLSAKNETSLPQLHNVAETIGLFPGKCQRV